MSSFSRSYRELASLSRPLWVLAGASLINRCGAMVLAFITLYFIKVLGHSLLVAGALTAVYSAGSVLSAPVSAYLCQRYSAWRVLTFSVILSGFVMLVYPWVTALSALIPLTFIFGCVTEVARPAGYTCYGQLAPKDQKRQAFALHRLSVNLGMSLGPLLGGLLATIDYRYIFWADGVTSILAGLVLLAWSTDVNVQVPKEKKKRSREPLPTRFKLFILGNFVGLLVFTQLFAGVPLFAVEFVHLSEAQAGLLFTCNTLLVLIFEAPLVYLTKQWKLSRALTLGHLFQGGGMAVLGVWPTFGGMLCGVALFTVGEMLQAPLGLAYVSESVSAENLPVANSWLAGTGSVAFLIGPPLTAYSLEQFGGIGHWSIVGTLGLLAAIWMWTLGDPDN
jgi:MFS family permease